MQLLLVEDQKRLAGLLKRSLIEDGYAVDIASDGQEAIDKFDINNYDLIILDIMLPIKDGIEVCQEIRRSNTDIPILMLTALDGVDDRIKGLDSGADDYLVKPFSDGELSARVRALLRRSGNGRPTILIIGELVLNPATKSVTYKGTLLPLTAKEYTLLSYFMYHAGELLSKNDLLEHVWDMNYDGLSNVVETYVRYLRKRLRDVDSSKELITTVRNLGYRLDA
ncbi:response regulator [Candidatus Mycosynbacter amalyticus]|uniref:Response regulator n=1 Tax=Candidatus Mycosynbacter amalyticus TaxID=2665156 RepID=A0A857MLZ0_9BACT|nr:response regulator transcription factor [Candidatus Mycosynbacter amalyticus]QHN42289.1 response regulator [Candidatus Mycosynbacter amalyticus]